MSQPWADPDRARRAVNDPSTSPADLSAIAQQCPELRVRVAWHNAAYPGLLEWLAKYGGPGVAAAVISRQNADQAMLTQTLSFPAAYGSADVRDAAANNPGPARWRAPVAQRFAHASAASSSPKGKASPQASGSRTLDPAAAGVDASAAVVSPDQAKPPTVVAPEVAATVAAIQADNDVGVTTGSADQPSNQAIIASETFPGTASLSAAAKRLVRPAAAAGAKVGVAKSETARPAVVEPRVAAVATEVDKTAQADQSTGVNEVDSAKPTAPETATRAATETVTPPPAPAASSDKVVPPANAIPPAPVTQPAPPASPPHPPLPEVLAPAPSAIVAPDPIPAAASSLVSAAVGPASTAAPSAAATSTVGVFGPFGAPRTTAELPVRPKVSRLTVVAVVATLVIALVAVVIGILLLVLPAPDAQTDGLTPALLTTIPVAAAPASQLGLVR